VAVALFVVDVDVLTSHSPFQPNLSETKSGKKKKQKLSI